MGGTIKTSFRLDAETVITDTRWTNPLPAFVHDPAFVAADRPYIETFARAESPYRGSTKLAPEGYGLVCFDLPSHTILVFASDFVSYAETHYVSVVTGARDPETRVAWEALLADGRLSSIEATYEKGDGPYGFVRSDVVTPLKPEGDIEAQFKALFRIDMDDETPNKAHLLGVDLGDWKVERFNAWDIGNRKEGVAMRARLAELGFAVTPEDEAAWEAWDVENERHD